MKHNVVQVAEGQHFRPRSSQVAFRRSLENIYEDQASTSTLPEQRAIAHVLGTLDDKIELNRRMNETLEEMARALFKSWFVDFLPVRAKMAAKQNNPSLLLPQAESGTWFVYAIECADGSLDIGQTENLRQRWLQHSSSKGGRWTKSHPPQRVAYWEKQPSRQAAVEREKWLKTGFGRKWLKKEIATRTQTGDPVRAKMEGRDTGLPKPLADLFPDRLVDSELGPIPEGWGVKAIGDIVRRISVGRKYSQKTAAESGIVPILDQGKSGIIGYHNGKPGVEASTNEPIIVFANHTCYMRLIMHDFSAIQNVLPFQGKNHNIYWLFCATIGKQEFIEYKGHWPDFSIKKIVVPERILQSRFGRVVAAFFRQAYINDSQSRTLATQRDVLLPKLVSGEVRVRKLANNLAEIWA